MGSPFQSASHRPAKPRPSSGGPPSVATCFLLLILLGSCSWAATEPAPRTALVIGNEHYETSVGPLRNTGNDARAVAKTLRGLGFSVIERHDITRDQLLRAIEMFRKTLPGAEVGLFYYAGHGLSISGANYLIPLKAGFDPAGADEISLRMMAETRLFNAEQAVADMSSAGARCNLVILDACRTNRLPASGRTRGGTPGGLVEMTPPAGSLIAFSTDAGRTAFDGDGSNGLYTEELLKNLATPGLTVEQVFKRTRAGVLKRSEGGQLPAEYSRLVGEDVYLAGQMPIALALPVADPASTPEANPEKTDAEIEAEVIKAAASGNATEVIDGLRQLARIRGPGDYAVKPLDALLEHVKDDLKTASAPSPRVIAAAATCESILAALPDCLPKDSPKATGLAARAHNRRGDALLLLGRPGDALVEFDAAQPLDPTDAYILYNRGRAKLALGRREEARTDFKAAADARLDQPKARKLAEQALAGLR